MRIKARPFQDGDFVKIMDFLRRIYNETGSIWNWFPDRFENSYEERIDDIQIWENVDIPKEKSIVGLTTVEGELDYHLQIDPRYKYLASEIVDWIIDHEQRRQYQETKYLRVHNIEGNYTTEEVLVDHGFVYDKIWGYLRFRPVDLEIPDYQIPANIQIRPVDGDKEFGHIALLVQKIFGHGEWFTAEILEGIARSSYYKSDLDLVALVEGKLAAFITFRMDPICKITNLEPMGTHPDYRKMGLATFLIYEGLKQLIKYNPSLLYIGGAANTPAANSLYDKTGYSEKYEDQAWVLKIS